MVNILKKQRTSQYKTMMLLTTLLTIYKELQASINTNLDFPTYLFTI